MLLTLMMIVVMVMVVVVKKTGEWAAAERVHERQTT
jgi:ABC-type cobalt transport system substrate-binding protein